MFRFGTNILRLAYFFSPVNDSLLVESGHIKNCRRDPVCTTLHYAPPSSYVNRCGFNEILTLLHFWSALKSCEMQSARCLFLSFPLSFSNQRKITMQFRRIGTSIVGVKNTWTQSVVLVFRSHFFPSKNGGEPHWKFTANIWFKIRAPEHEYVDFISNNVNYIQFTWKKSIELRNDW